MGLIGEIHFEVKDKYGNIRKQWNENTAGKYIRRSISKFVHRHGLQSRTAKYLASHGLRIPFLLGGYGSKAIIRNTITNAGLAGMASRCNGSGSEAAFTYLGVGTGTTAASASDTTLETEITDSGLARASATASRETTTVTNDTATLDKTFSVTGTKAVTEAGALNAASSGVLLGRQVFSAINVVNGDSLQITYKFAFASA